MKKVYQVFDRFYELIASFDNEDAAKNFCYKIGCDSSIEEIEILTDCPKEIVYKVTFDLGKCSSVEAFPFTLLKDNADFECPESDYYEFCILAENTEKAKEYAKTKLENAEKASRS